MKRCWACKSEKPLEQFAKNRTKSSGRSAECKACVAAYNKRHVAANEQYYREYRQAKRKARLAWYLFLECRTRAKRMGLAFDLEPSDIVIPKVCPVFAFSLSSERRDTSASIDRIDCMRGYVKGNIRVISYLANRMKSNATESQLRLFAHWILEDLKIDSARGMDPSKSKRPDQNRCADPQAYRSCTWESGNDGLSSDGGVGVTQENLTGSRGH